MEKYEPLNNFFKNKRRHRRFAVDGLDVHVRTQDADRASAAPEDYIAKMLNLGGMLIESSRPHEQHGKLRFELTLPEKVSLSITGRVTFCLSSKDVKGARYEVGIEFTDMSEQDKTKLKKFIHWLYLKDAGFTE